MTACTDYGRPGVLQRSTSDTCTSDLSHTWQCIPVSPRLPLFAMPVVHLYSLAFLVDVPQEPVSLIACSLAVQMHDTHSQTAGWQTWA